LLACLTPCNFATVEKDIGMGPKRGSPVLQVVLVGGQLGFREQRVAKLDFTHPAMGDDMNGVKVLVAREDIVNLVNAVVIVSEESHIELTIRARLSLDALNELLPALHAGIDEDEFVGSRLREIGRRDRAAAANECVAGKSAGARVTIDIENRLTQRTHTSVARVGGGKCVRICLYWNCEDEKHHENKQRAYKDLGAGFRHIVLDIDCRSHIVYRTPPHPLSCKLYTVM
jgi:hypothetical protein